MPARFARATASLASSRGGSIMPISPAKTRSRSMCSPTSSRSSASRRPTRGTRRRACAARVAASASFASRISRRRVVGQRTPLLADQLVRAARQQHVGRAFREDEHAPARFRRRCGPCSSACARTRTAPRRRARSAGPDASACRPAFRAATISAPSVGSPCDRPASVALLQRRRCWPDRRRRARAPARSAGRPSTGAAALPTHVADRRVPRPAEQHAAARRDDLAHGHLVLRQRAGLVGRDDRSPSRASRRR